MLVLGLVLDGDGKVALVVDAYTTIFFFDAWVSDFSVNFVILHLRIRIVYEE